MKYLTIGHASYDITFRLDKFPIENTKQRVSKHIDCGGGPASNAGYLLALWDCDVSFQGVAGNDYYGKMIKAEFNSVGVDTTYLELVDNFDTWASASRTSPRARPSRCRCGRRALAGSAALSTGCFPASWSRCSASWWCWRRAASSR